MFKGIVKTLIGLLVVVALVIAAIVGVTAYCTGSQTLSQAVASATGSKSLGSLVADIANGKDVNDAQYIEALGIDEQSFAKFKKAAKRAQINLNDSSKLKDTLTENIGKIDLSKLADKEAIDQLKLLLGMQGAS